jgi:uncharacterized protein (DUF1330 family)
MQRFTTIGLAMLAGALFGGAAVQGLHAQAKAPFYYLSEIDVTNLDGYIKEYAPVVQASIRQSGGRQLAGGQNVVSFEGAPPARRIALTVWDSNEQIRTWRNSPEYKKAREIGDKHAKFRAFSFEGMAQ